MRYFVTGATGFVGGRVIQQLTDAGHEVHAVVRDPEKAGDLKARGVHLFKGDVTDKESMRAAMQGTAGIFHIAGWYKIGTRDKRDGERVNIQGTRNVLELMKELGIPKGVYTSTLAVHSDTHGRLVDESHHFDGQHLSEYDRTKAVAHDIAHEMMSKGLPLVIVQPGLIYGPGDTSTLRTNLIDFLQRKLPMVPRGTALCLSHVDDVARGHILAMEKGQIGETYHIAGEPVTLVEVFKLAQDITGIPAPMTMPAGMIKLMSQIMSVVEKVIPLPETYTAEGLRIVAGVTYLGDSSKARRELGFRARPLREGLEATLQHEMALLGMQSRRRS